MTAVPFNSSTMPPASPVESLADESALLARLKAGDPGAYEQVVREMGGRMLAVARRILVDENESQDAVQDAFVSAFRNIAKFEGNSQIATWLHRITVNACLMRLRKKRRQDEVSLDALLPSFGADGHPAHAASPWRQSPTGDELAETRESIRAAIAKLPEHYRIVLVLRDIEALDTAQTAALLETTEAAVKIRLHRARQALRELLDSTFRDSSN
ncbi:MAG: sigma-70 family RNA polymerase sigma factor [Phycisphaeraceae bacterium]|nr:sigma-70 family RNA polymerase sigma factor [Phycisphaeraceae bacterium]